MSADMRSISSESSQTTSCGISLAGAVSSGSTTRSSCTSAPNRRAQAAADALVDALAEAGAGRERLGATGVEGAPRVDAVFVSYVPR